MALNPTDSFQVTVTGGSGTAVVTQQVAGGFWGLSDPTGLTSVTFADLGSPGSSNYSFDNVTTAGLAQVVPEPTSSLALVAVGLAGLGWRRRARLRRRK